MLHHISVAVNNPRHVATVMAEIMQGQVAPFPFNPGSFVAMAGDELGTMIEFYPLGSELIPDAHEGQAGFRLVPQPTRYVSFHAAISVPISLEEIERIADRAGWRVFPCSRDGLFDVIELWVENWLMIELLTPAIAPKYLAAFSPANIAELVNQLSLVDARR
ncbi:hypothetical protein XM38_039030 [Halomicronema hongdechloris C2206]|uniref:VOC domain-containing protein n=1 Tax=Halomicronema hongdechloris C2206 TaxID=1641165 RepID=A0A1Z3HRJ6_9CYAN|nr:hypothetical protein [Halomicronema hongdechloris]ASC72943.1 hypothetical protein XM38_039030 [Halomicronema hongdechloris C2206]